MRIQVISSAYQAQANHLIGKTVLVIDVLRASSTITAALHAGASCVIPVETVMDAKKIKSNMDILGGERFCKKISGFHIGNSPLDCSTELVKDKRVILTTTNGTRAILKASKATNVIVACLNNARVSAETAIAMGKDIVLLCAGSHDEFTIEDGICAGYLIYEMMAIAKVQQRLLTVDDFGKGMLAMYHQYEDRLDEILGAGLIGSRLKRMNQQEDIYHCAKRNIYENVPIYLSSGSIVNYVLHYS